MSSLPPAFDTFRHPYRGATDSINDIDVDPHGGCVYAACSSGDVLVWDVATLQLKAQLRHTRWVNAVRCFPLANSSASLTAAAAAAATTSTDPLFAKLRSRSEIRWVLTGSEDGVVSVWSPMTYRTQSSCRPSLSAITRLQLLPFTAQHKKKMEGAAEKKSEAGTSPSPSGRDGGAGQTTREAESALVDDVAFLCAASLQHIHVLKVTSTSAELSLLRSLQHTVLITAMTPVVAVNALLLLAVGQEDGTLCLWNCVDWLYHDTLPYPAGEDDVDKDAATHPGLLHEPQYEHGTVLHTFAYNRRRCNAATPDDAAVPRVRHARYQRAMPTAVSAEASGLVEQRFGALPAALQSVLTSARRPDRRTDVVPLPAELPYDARRITCLASRPGTAGGAAAHLFSGHATGAVLLWASVRKELPFLLLKKIVLFKPGAWVWGMCAVHSLVTTIAANEAAEDTKAAKPKPKTLLRGKGASNVKKSPAAVSSPVFSSGSGGCGTVSNAISTLYYSPLELIVWSDGGVVEYVSSHGKQIVHRQGPGFLASASTCWLGEPTSVVQPEKVEATAVGSRSSTSPRSNNKTRTSTSRKPEPSTSVATHQYMLLGNFEGRVERYDVTEVLGLVKSFGKAC